MNILQKHYIEIYNQAFSQIIPCSSQSYSESVPLYRVNKVLGVNMQNRFFFHHVSFPIFALASSSLAQ